MSSLGLLNFLILQWTGFRLALTIERIQPSSSRACVLRCYWAILGPVVPLTGWWGRYVPKRPKLRRLTRGRFV